MAEAEPSWPGLRHAGQKFACGKSQRSPHSRSPGGCSTNPREIRQAT
jgi:hypothetical protein